MSLQKCSCICRLRRPQPLLHSLAWSFSTGLSGHPATHQSISQLLPARSQIRSKVTHVTRDTFSKARFTKDDLPPREFWAERTKPPLNLDVNPDECVKTAEMYATLALQNHSGWREELVSQHGLSLCTLHYIACMIILGPQSPLWNLATHIFDTNVRLSYLPSILTMARLGLRVRKHLDPQFAPAVEAVNALTASDSVDDSNLFTLRGMILADDHVDRGDDQALYWFQRAAKLSGVAATERPTWDWQCINWHGMAHIYKKRKHMDRLKAVLKHAAEELEYPMAMYEYAVVMAGDKGLDSKGRRLMLEKAAMGGVEGAAQLLGQLYRESAADEKLNEGERAEMAVLADEWSAIGEVRAPASPGAAAN